MSVELGDKIVSLTLKEAKELSDYLADIHGIKPAAGGAVMMAAPADGGGPAKPAEQTEWCHHRERDIPQDFRHTYHR